jgi:hypothetical protein
MGGFSDGGWHLRGATRWNSQILYTHQLSRHQFCCFTVAPLFALDKSMAWNRCLQHP